MNFDVLAFESGLYDLRLATERATTPDEYLQAATNTLSRPWAESKQVRPVLRYYAETQTTETPLHLAGIDGALRPPSDSLFLVRLKSHLLSQNQWAEVVEGTNFEQTLRTQLRNPLALARDTAAYRQFITQVDRLIQPLEDGSSKDEFWALMLENVKAQVQTGFQRSYEPRNRQMAHNLVWLAAEAHPDRKLIVWIASSHGVRNLSSIERITADRSYEGQTSMGDVLAEKFDGGIYTLGITAHGGKYGAFYWDDQGPTTLDEPSAGSVEALLGTLSHDYSVLDFTDVPSSHWLSKPQVARPLGYEEMRADWTEVMDGLLFIRTMHPNTKVDPNSNVD
ncbi:erythromycin esterase family protein [Longibacter sp.]|uniref:erythromycin esterase family protein n=1 Tax=Longibacter sp. TaxID=2045415 RepID=UPI003EB9DA5F